MHGQSPDRNPLETATPAAAASHFSRTAVRDAGLIAVAVFVASWLGILTRPEQQLAAFWPTNALLMGLFARRPQMANPLAWPAATLAYLAADLVTGTALPVTLRLTAANLAGVAVGFALFQRLRREDRGLQRPQSMLRVLVICVAAALAAAAVGSAAARSVIGVDPGTAIGIWFSAELVSYVALVPVVLLAPSLRDLRSAWREHLHRFRHAPDHRLPALSLLLTVLMGVSIGGPGAIAFPVPALLWCALSYRLFTTATATMLLCIWTLMAIANDWIDLHLQQDMAAVISIRIGMALVAVAPLTVAGANAARDRLLNALNHAANHDSLTQALSRSAFLRRGRVTAGRTMAAAGPIAAMMVDVDHFKSINDRYGHAAGDAVLVMFVQRAREVLREADLLGRFGGEEFAVLMPATDEADALHVAERLRHGAALPFELDDGQRLHVTISIGLAMHRPQQDGEPLEALLKRADRALYLAKTGGRNRVEVAGTLAD